MKKKDKPTIIVKSGIYHCPYLNDDCIYNMHDDVACTNCCMSDFGKDGDK